MSWINATHPFWYIERAKHFGGSWVSVHDYPKDMEPAAKEVGAIIADDGKVIYRIKRI